MIILNYFDKIYTFSSNYEMYLISNTFSAFDVYLKLECIQTVEVSVKILM